MRFPLTNISDSFRTDTNSVSWGVSSENGNSILPQGYSEIIYTSVSQPPGRGPLQGPGINYTGPREILLELITNLNVILYLQHATPYT